MSKSYYSESVKRLRKFLKEKEDYRRDWANEKWSHSDGRMFKIGRILVPVLSLVGIFLMAIVCMVRFVNIPAIGMALANNGSGFNTTAKDDPIIYPFFILVFIALCLLVYTAIRFIKKEHKKTPFFLFGTSLFLALSALFRFGADQGTFPDNSNYDGAPTFTYFEYCLFTLAVFGVLTIYAIILMAIAIYDKKEFNRNVEHTLFKIIPQNKDGDLLTEDEYAKLIDEYIVIETEKQEIGKLPKKEAKKRKKELEQRINKTSL